jgi:hypothetical protein
MVNYVYLDEQGIQSLYAQTVQRLEVEHSTTIERALGGKAGGAARFRNLLLKVLGGPELELTGELSGSRRRTEQSRNTQTVEQKLDSLLDALRQIRETALFFSDLRDAATHLEHPRTSVFVRIEDDFDAPQFIGGNGSESVNEAGYLILQKGGPGHYNYGDDYYRDPSLPIKLHASVSKMSGGGMAGSSHLAVYFRGFNGREIPLGVFGAMAKTPAYFHIKPYAIWR